MVKKFTAIMIMLCMLCLVGCNNTTTVLENETTTDVSNPTTESNTENQEENQEDDSISVIKVEGLSEDFMMGADVSSLLSLEASGRKFYGFDSKEQDLFMTLKEAGINYIRVRVWNNPFDEKGNGYGGGNCTVDTAIELGKRAAEYGIGLMVDFHYSDFWADPGKQQAPKEWEHYSVDEKAQAIYDFTVESINKIHNSGIKIGMVQVGNETTGGICGEFENENIYKLIGTGAKAVRDTDNDILISVHYTNPERMNYSEFANLLKAYEVDYDIFATSYYPEYHGTIANLKEQLETVHNISGKNVMIAETSWSYSSSEEGAYDRSVQGQADEIRDCINAMVELGDYAVGVFYWEPAWIDVPGKDEAEKNNLRETHGAGWASSFAGAYDPVDAGKYYGKTACIYTSLFDEDGYPLESLKTFLYVRSGKGDKAVNYINNPSLEENDYSMWKVTELVKGTVNFKESKADAKEGANIIHFWNDKNVEFKIEQEIENLPNGDYTFNVYLQGDGEDSDSDMYIYVISDGIRYEEKFSLDGWLKWSNPTINNIKCTKGSVIVGVEIKASPGTWGTIDMFELTKK